MKKLIVLLMVVAMMLALSACGKDKVGSTQGSVEEDQTVWYLGGNNIMAGDVDVKALFADVEDSIDPAKIYNSIEYTEAMLYGGYTLYDEEKDVKKVRKEIPFEEVAFKTGAQSITTLPVGVYFGSDNICSSETGYKYGDFEAVTDCELAVLKFATKEQLGTVVCSYEVEGRSVTFKQLEQTSEENQPFTYAPTGIEFKYDFKVEGPYFTLSKGENSLKLTAFCFTKKVNSNLSITGYSLPDSPLIGEVDYFSSASAWNYAVKRDGSYYDLSAYKLTDKGIFTFYLRDKGIDGEKEEFIQQYTYIVQSSCDNVFTDFSIIFLDGETTYYYTDDITQREARVLKDQGMDVNAMTEEQIKEIAEKKEDLFADLSKEFEAAGINATVNRATGEIAIDSTVLFGGDSAVVTDEGKAFLNKFISVYTSVVFSEKYNGFISKTLVEGHTAPVEGSTYESGLPLSQERATNVMNYCLSSETGVDTSKLASALEAVGCSNSKPIYGSDGTVDKAASRRVSFKFVVNVGE